MICPLYKNCVQHDCGWWDEEREQCVALSIKQSLFDLTMFINRLTEAILKGKKIGG